MNDDNELLRNVKEKIITNEEENNEENIIYYKIVLI